MWRVALVILGIWARNRNKKFRPAGDRLAADRADQLEPQSTRTSGT